MFEELLTHLRSRIIGCMKSYGGHHEVITMSMWIILAFMTISSLQGQLIDNRCLLENGGSSDSFFVSEDLKVGSFIGTLRIFGDAGEYGTIDVRLKETDSPVSVTPFTKNLTLTKQLDKEGVDGPASVFVNVICERKRSLDPHYVIPISIRVTDVNDNAPKFINAPYVLNVSEVTVVGTRVLQGVRAVDADQQGVFSTVHYSILQGPYSDYFSFLNGLEGTLVLLKPLDYESLPNFTLSVRAQDQGIPSKYSETILFVRVIDADDQNPKFLDDRYSATLPERPTQGSRLKISPREISALDQDIGIRSPVYYGFNSEGSDYRYFEINRDTGYVFLKKTIADDDLSQPATVVIKATQYDNPDRYALATLTVSRSGNSLHDLQFLQSQYNVAILENVPINSVILTAVTNKPRDKRLKYWLTAHNDMFTVKNSGDIILKKSLDYEATDSYMFLVFATDGYMNVSASVNLSVLNVNDWDPRFRYPQYEFIIPDVPPEQLVAGTVIGRVEAADGDRGDHVALSLRGPNARLFSVDDSGEIYVQDLKKFNTSTVHLVVVATDSGSPPRQASVPVIVHLPETIVTSASRWMPNNATMAMVLSFGTILCFLAIVIVILVVYIQKHKKVKGDEGNESDRYMATPTVDKQLVNYGKVNNPVFNGGDDFNGDPFQVNMCTATVKRSPNGTGNHRNVNANGSLAPHRGRHKIAPAPPPPPQVPSSHSSRSSNGATPSPTHDAYERNFWSAGSIPRRVKKLSWDDDSVDSSQQGKVALDPDVSVTPLLSEPKNPDQVNLTVYF